ITNDGSESGLLSYLGLSPDDEETVRKPLAEIKNDHDAPIMVASAKPENYWTQRVDNIFTSKHDFSIVETAFASQSSGRRFERDGLMPAIPEHVDLVPPNIGPFNPRMQQGFVKILHKNGFGPQICTSMRQLSEKYDQPLFSSLLDDDCADRFEVGFGTHLA